MTPDEMHSHPESCSGDVAAYALGALDAKEVHAFERHLRSCPVCPVELATFQQVVGDLALSAPHQPAPAALRRRVMRGIADEPRLDPSARRERRRSRLQLSFPRPTFALSAGLAVVAAAVVVAVFALPGGSSSTRTIAAQVSGRGSAALKLSGGHAHLVVDHFTPPPHGQIYEVWLKHGGGTISPTTALFSVNRDGDGDVDVPGSLKGVDSVLVTAEPAGGTKQPTTVPVISATLS